MDEDRKYHINIDPRILELLGPSLYTNIYYVLAELIANAYDAGASNVYIIKKENAVVVEDDGEGMSYEKGDIKKYLNVAIETRTTNKETYTTDGRRRKMGRKGVGKLAALSVSENVLVMTKKNNEKSGFILSRHVREDKTLQPIPQEDILFEQIETKPHGTSIVMTNPEYGMHKTAEALKRNLIKIFPLVNKDFRIHIITQENNLIIDSFDKITIEGLGALITIGSEYESLVKYFDSGLPDKTEREKTLVVKKDLITIPLKLKNKYNEQKTYKLEIKGWIGAYKSTSGRKNDRSDFPDNFISLLSNGKLGEYNILYLVGKNRLPEVYVVGQLYIDLFEETELPDMALSNRQGYKTDDLRYKTVIDYVRDELLPQIIELRVSYAEYVRMDKDKSKFIQQKKEEDELKQKVDEFKNKTSDSATQKITDQLGEKTPEGVNEIIKKEINKFLPLVGLKSKIDSQKKKILLCHTSKNKTLSDLIYKMLSFNGTPDADIIYTSSDNEDCRIPNKMSIFDYLRTFFVESYSDKKMTVIYITSDDMARAWGAVSEVGAGWITQSNHDIFNVDGHKPQAPLDVASEWQTSKVDGENILMTAVEADKFIVKIRSICANLGYSVKNKESNLKELKRYIYIRS